MRSFRTILRRMKQNFIYDLEDKYDNNIEEGRAGLPDSYGAGD